MLEEYHLPLKKLDLTGKDRNLIIFWYRKISIYHWKDGIWLEKIGIWLSKEVLKSNFRQYGQMKSRDGKSQRREEKKKEDQTRESLRRKKIQVREKIGKSRNTVFFQWFVAPESGGSKSRLAKAGQMRDEKIARPCGAKHISKSKCTKRTRSGPLLEVEMSKKCTPLWREARFKVEMYQALQLPTTFWRSDVVSHGRRKGLCTVSKVSKTWGFCSISKKMAGVGHLKRICKDVFSVAGAVQKTCSSELLGGPSADFLRGVTFWTLRSAGLLRWFCVTGAALRMTWHHFFVAGAVV